MAWRGFMTQMDTADIDGSTKTHAMKIKPNSDIVLRGLRTWFVFFDTTFTALSLRIYEDQNGSAGKLIATSSTSYAPTDLFSLDYAIKGVGFAFSDLPLLGTSYYHILPYVTGYTGSDSNFIAWVHGWPDNEYRTGLDLTYEEGLRSPYRLAVVGAPF